MKNALTAAELRDYVTYDPETGLFTRNHTRRRWKAGTVMTGSIDRHGHVRVPIYGSPFAAHRLAFLYMTGEWPPHDVDHINGKRDDNRWTNLRPATRAQNLWNMRRKANKTGFKGVTAHGPSFKATIRHHYATIYLGTFPTPEEAHAAYVAAAERLHGKFANPG